ncbi:MAG: RcpA [Hyphomicrobiales bacterium]|nr:RcpA [Hyphomicrobiales bacterium]
MTSIDRSSHFSGKATSSRGRLIAMAIGAALFSAAFAAPAFAGEPTSLRVSSAETGRTQHVSVGVNKSLILDLPTDVREVIVSQPTIASATMRSKRRAIIQANTPGDTNIFFLDAKGQQISVLEISSVKDSSTLSTAIARLVPGSAIAVQSFADHVVLSGTAQSNDDVNKALAIAAQFTGDPKNVANVINISGEQQVMLKVTVAEVSREVVKQLGLDLSASVNGGLSTSFVNNPVMGDVSGATSTGTYTAGGNVAGVSIQATLRALDRRNAVKTLAQPTLTAMSGQPAQFLAGGELPYSSTDANGNSTVTFKPYGVQLAFTPTVKSNGLIGLLIDTSVSEPVSGGALTTRQAKTTVELRAGMTLAIGGLLQDKVRQEINSFPGLGNIPILGALFRSRDFIQDKTELLILVTPYFDRAMTSDPVLPTDKYPVAGDAEAIFLGHMKKMYGVGDDTNTAAQYHGSVGFSLE